QISLDYFSELFQTLTHSHDDVVWSDIAGRTLAKNTITEKIPVILHFNGPKHYLEDWWSKMWFFHTDDASIGVLKRINGAWIPTEASHLNWGWKSWNDLCGNH